MTCIKKPMTCIKAVFNWSGGKDSAHALLKAMQSGKYEIIYLLTVVDRETGCSTMHGIPLDLLEAQSESIGIPLYIVNPQSNDSAADYERAMSDAVRYFKSLGVTHFIFGDMFLHDIKKYREDRLEPYGIEVVEPLWGKSSMEVMHDYLESGLRTVVVTTMADSLGEKAIGKEVDSAFVASLPDDVDPNGENGEYHTFCFDGPLFRSPVPFRLGKVFTRSYDVRSDDGKMETCECCCASLSRSDPFISSAKVPR